MASNQSSQIGQICKYFDKKEVEKVTKLVTKLLRKKRVNKKGMSIPVKERAVSFLASNRREASATKK